MSEKKLIVNADDFGQSSGISKGIIQAHEQGIVTSASLMVRYPAAIDAANYAKSNYRLGVGLHVDLGEWTYADGNWQPLYEVVSLDDAEEVQKEINKQLETFYELMDRKPTHIDSHQHVHLREETRSIFIQFARDLNVTLRRCSQKVNYCGLFYGQTTDGAPSHDAINIEGLSSIIKTIPEGITEMACHPGLGNDITTMYRVEREKEVMTLCDKRTMEIIDTAQIELRSFEGIPFAY